ncbi:MAG TPA: hypothetical protein VHD82_34820 [Amycolatopsis sp.]|nr:hypothetical protein [Amycolatopsis sp.]HVV14433.1 hypothetical protein [Amycolatopsis sp.]
MTDGVVTCTRCGVNREAELDPEVALSWVSEKDNEAQRWLCPLCAREHLRAIEGKLPDEYW